MSQITRGGEFEEDVCQLNEIWPELSFPSHIKWGLYILLSCYPLVECQNQTSEEGSVEDGCGGSQQPAVSCVAGSG